MKTCDTAGIILLDLCLHSRIERLSRGFEMILPLFDDSHFMVRQYMSKMLSLVLPGLSSEKGERIVEPLLAATLSNIKHRHFGNHNWFALIAMLPITTSVRRHALEQLRAEADTLFQKGVDDLQFIDSLLDSQVQPDNPFFDFHIACIKTALDALSRSTVSEVEGSNSIGSQEHQESRIDSSYHLERMLKTLPSLSG